MPRKKIVFVMVEGPSDEEALGAVLSKAFDQNSVFVHIMRCDVTTERGVGSGNILMRVGNVIRAYAANNHFKKTDFQQIIHLLDMDGAYIPNDRVMEDKTAQDHCYCVTEIRTGNKPGIELRNKQKRENIDKLITAKALWGVPYQAFYMSCNLDHVLYNKQNSSDEDKERDAYRFALRYRNDLPAFWAFIALSDFSVMTGYLESWDYIRAGLHSLERHSNIGLCLQAGLASATAPPPPIFPVESAAK